MNAFQADHLPLTFQWPLLRSNINIPIAQLFSMVFPKFSRFDVMTESSNCSSWHLACAGRVRSIPQDDRDTSHSSSVSIVNWSLGLTVGFIDQQDGGSGWPRFQRSGRTTVVWVVKAGAPPDIPSSRAMEPSPVQYTQNIGYLLELSSYGHEWRCVWGERSHNFHYMWSLLTLIAFDTLRRSPNIPDRRVWSMLKTYSLNLTTIYPTRLCHLYSSHHLVATLSLLV